MLHGWRAGSRTYTHSHPLNHGHRLHFQLQQNKHATYVLPTCFGFKAGRTSVPCHRLRLGAYLPSMRTEVELVHRGSACNCAACLR